MRKAGSAIVSVEAWPLTLPMSEPFEIAGGSRSKVENVLVKLSLADGSVGWGECAPLPSFNGETQAAVLKSVHALAPPLLGQDASRWLAVCRRVEGLPGGHGSARAGVEMALLDAWTRRLSLPLWAFFGGAGTSVVTDVTIPIVPPHRAAEAARKLWRRGIRALKIKVGKDPQEDELRVLAAARAAPKAEILLDANQGFTAQEAWSLARRLRARGVRPALFEQPVAKEDLDGLKEVARKGGIPVAADEAVSSLSDAWRLARRRSAAAINVKLMKFGLAEALDVVYVARSAGMELMMGGMIESNLAMACAAHFAAGLGGFRFIDLDTPLWFSRNPMRGAGMDRRGVYELARVRAGIGVVPLAPFCQVFPIDKTGRARYNTD